MQEEKQRLLQIFNEVAHYLAASQCFLMIIIYSKSLNEYLIMSTIQFSFS